MKILGIGQVVLDKVVVLEDFPEENTKVEPLKQEYSLGGPVTTALIFLARLDIDATFATPLSKDDVGNLISNKLKKENVKVIPGKLDNTKVNTVLINSKSGARTIIRGKEPYYTLKELDEKLIKEADVIIFDRHEPDIFDEVIAKKKPEARVIMDPSTEVSDKTKHMLKHCDYPIIPIESIEELDKKQDINENLKGWYEILQKPIIVTAGDYGSFLYDDEKATMFPAYQVEAIDKNGAGDIYRGAFAYGIMRNWAIEECIDYANMIAAMQCTKLGNHSAIPTKEEIEAFKKSGELKEVKLEDLGIKS